MKKLKIVIIIYSFMYVSVSFIKMDLNPMNWLEDDRIICGVISPIMSIIIIAVKSVSEDFKF